MKRAMGIAAVVAVLVAGCSSGTKPPSSRCESVSGDRAAQILIDQAGNVGVWASAGAIETGMVASVDTFAEQFSGILKDSRFSSTDSGAEEARTCVTP